MNVAFAGAHPDDEMFCLGKRALAVAGDVTQSVKVVFCS